MSANRIPGSIPFLLLCAGLWLAGCTTPALSPAPSAETRVHAAFVLIGENGAAIARAIVPGHKADAACPLIEVDGVARPMVVRALPATIAQRPTASDADFSKPSSFPVLACEFALPGNVKRASVEGSALRLPKAEPQRIVLIGDTGCRLKKSDNAWQDCLDSDRWPFRAIAAQAAAMAPDLVIHVGDYHYRENPCPTEFAGCQDSPWGYGWDTWQADLFDPAAKLLAAAPWVVVRGNHEECRRAGQGWFRFLDVGPFDEKRSCDDEKYDVHGNFTPPYAVPLSRDSQLIVFDSAVSGGRVLDPAKPADAGTFARYREQFAMVDVLAGKAGVSSIFINHHPILGYASDPHRGLRGGSPALVSVMKTLHPRAYYPASVNLALHGHVHLFEAISFASNHPATVLSGIGGDLTDFNLPDPFPAHIGPAEGVVLESIVHSNQFGFVVMDRRDRDWQISAYDYRGARKVTCMLTGTKLRCDKSGLIR